MSLAEAALARAKEKLTAPADKPAGLDPLQVAIEDYEKAETPAQKLEAMRNYMRLANHR